MRGLPFSLVCAHLQTETQGLKEKVVLNLDNMVHSHWSGRCAAEKLEGKRNNVDNPEVFQKHDYLFLMSFLSGRIATD